MVIGCSVNSGYIINTITEVFQCVHIIPALSEAEGEEFGTSLGHGAKKEKKMKRNILEIVFYLEFILRKELNEQKSKEINILHSF